MSLRRNTLWNFLGAGGPLIVGAVTIPYLIKQIGVEAFGILTLVWAIIGYFSLFDFGLGRALTQQVAQVRASGSDVELPSLVKTGLGFTGATGVAGGAIFAALAYVLATQWLNVSLVLQHDTFLALLVAAVGIPFTTVTTGLRGILEAYEEFRIANVLRMILGIANFLLPAVSAMFMGKSLIWMVVGLVVARIFVLGGHLWAVNKNLPAGWLRAKFSKKNIRKLLSFGLWMAVSNIISPLMVTADRFFISAVLGANVVAYYTVPTEGLVRVLIIPGALTAALFPRLAVIMATDLQKAKKLYSKCTKTVAIFLLPICLLLMMVSKWGMQLWLGKEFAAHSWLIVCVLAIGLLFNGIAYVPFAAIQASGDARTTAYIHAIELLFYVPLLFTFLHVFGLIGAAFAWTLRVGLDLGILIIYTRRLFSGTK